MREGPHVVRPLQCAWGQGGQGRVFALSRRFALTDVLGQGPGPFIRFFHKGRGGAFRLRFFLGFLGLQRGLRSLGLQLGLRPLLFGNPRSCFLLGAQAGLLFQPGQKVAQVLGFDRQALGVALDALALAESFGVQALLAPNQLAQQAALIGQGLGRRCQLEMLLLDRQAQRR